MKLLLVEDEIHVLKSLEQKILDLNQDYEIIGTASNGTKALELIRQQTPDIVLTDIRMPGMDGLTLIREMAVLCPDAIAVIISGYQEFEYAKQAMSMGVLDYLLKPIDIQELDECLSHCRERCKEQQAKKRTNMVSVMMHEEKMPMTFHSDGTYVILYLIIGNPLQSADHIIHPSVPYIPSETMEERLHREFSTAGECYCFDGIFTNEKAVLLHFSRFHPDSFRLRLKGLPLSLAAELSYTVTIYADLRGQIDNLGNALKKCRAKAAQSVLLHKSTVRYAQDDPVLSNRKSITNDVISRYHLLLDQKQFDILKTSVHQLFDQWQQAERPVWFMEQDLVYLLDSLKYAMSSGTVFEFNSQFYIEDIISTASDYRNLEEHFYRLLLDLFETNAPVKETSADRLLQTAVDYFEQNISSNISLQMLSERMNVSQVYLCRIFKKQTDLTPIDYFVRLKIEKAKNMIQNYPNMPLKEISETLGFNDSYYFSKVFKKIMGVTPSGYKKSVG
ncbi:response regulator [Diplocloster hominis]|uniref:response regulator n=1 Tax=Diplocloster hominis TaxID=3079010 RepID=UPI0031BA0FB5